jgi:hypothetical protein
MAQDDMKATFAKLVAKSWSDPAFKKRLISDPKAVLRENGIQVPQGTGVKVMESTPQEWVMVIPPAPKSGELSDEALRGASGGTDVSLCVACCCC